MPTNVTVSDGSGVSTHKINFRGLTGAVFWLILISTLVFLIAFATEGWAENGSTKYGLWKTCTCFEASIQKESWYKASQAMFSIGLIFLIATLVLVGLYMIFHSLNKNTLLLLVIVATCLSALFLLIGLLVFGIEMDKNRNINLSYSYGFACITTIFCTMAACISIYLKIRSRGV